jgi:DNA-cytosine methyltransferase
MAVEWDKDCQKVYSTAFPETDLRGDIREVLSVTNGGDVHAASAKEIREYNLVPAHDILFAGFPCQPFSKGGAQKGMSEQTQGTLFHEIMRIVEARRPLLVILENVANLVGHDEGRTWDTIVKALRAAKYNVDREPLLISPHEIKKARGGAPQNRPRVYIVAVDSTKGLKVPDNSNLLDASDWRTATSPAWAAPACWAPCVKVSFSLALAGGCAGVATCACAGAGMTLGAFAGGARRAGAGWAMAGAA